MPPRCDLVPYGQTDPQKRDEGGKSAMKETEFRATGVRIER
jgi:hypothetical protein